MSEKILIICEVLGATPYELLSATEGKGKRSNESDIIILDKTSEVSQMMVEYLGMDERQQQSL